MASEPSLVWYDARKMQWLQVPLTGSCECSGSDDCHGEPCPTSTNRRLCASAGQLLPLPDRGVGGYPSAEMLYHACVTHFHYASRQQLLDEVAALAAARQLVRAFNATESLGVRREPLVVPAFVGLLSCGPHVPLRRVDSDPAGFCGRDVAPRAGDAAVATLRDTFSALSHFSWEASHHRCSVAVVEHRDATIVGVNVHTATDDAIPAFGELNGQRSALRQLQHSHRCGAVCRAMKLVPFAQAL